MKQSVPRSSGPPEPTFLLDENISSPKIYRALKAAGIAYRTFTEVLPRASTDVEVLMAASKNRLLLVTGDMDFRYHPAIRAAFPSSRTHVVVLASKKSMRAEETAALIVGARKKITAFVSETPAPALAKLGADGKLVQVRVR